MHSFEKRKLKFVSWKLIFRATILDNENQALYDSTVEWIVGYIHPVLLARSIHILKWYWKIFATFIKNFTSTHDCF